MLIENLHLYWTENSQSQSQSQSIIKLEKERKETKTDIKRIMEFIRKSTLQLFAKKLTCLASLLRKLQPVLIMKRVESQFPPKLCSCKLR